MAINDITHHLVALSASSEAALQQRVAALLAAIETGDADAAFSAATATLPTLLNDTHPYRLAYVVEDADDLARQLKKAGDSDEKIAVKPALLPIAFLFTGQGAQYTGMGKALYEAEPVFKQALETCADGLATELDIPLLDLLFDDAQEEALNQTGNTQPCLFAIEYALAKLWESWGVIPRYAMGHSVGEFTAATMAGVMSLADGLHLIAARARLMQALPAGGGMAAVLANRAAVDPVIDSITPPISIAGINGPRQTVISGELTALETATKAFEAQGIKVKPLAVSHAFHSTLMVPMLDDFTQVAARITYNAPRCQLVSNVTGSVMDASLIDAQYWRKHLRAPVDFLQGIQTLFDEGCNVFLEVGPHPVLAGMGTRCVTEQQKERPLQWLPSLRRKKFDRQIMLSSLAKLYVIGYCRGS